MVTVALDEKDGLIADESRLVSFGHVRGCFLENH